MQDLSGGLGGEAGLAIVLAVLTCAAAAYAALAVPPDQLARIRRVMRIGFRTISVLIVAALLIGTVLAYRAGTPANGGLLVSGVLGVITLLVALKLHSIDRTMHAEHDPVLRADLIRSMQENLAGKVQEALAGGGKVQWAVASPQVHRIDEATLATARSMADSGRSIDEICRVVERGYVSWQAPHQQAFRNVMQAALDHR